MKLTKRKPDCFINFYHSQRFPGTAVGGKHHRRKYEADKWLELNRCTSLRFMCRVNVYLKGEEQ